ncbi:MAG: DHH family phosphoesterase, partial [Gemmatimonadetes bacterium]|nr:DHH family phosphoesterase [Gemmatimonadota bacterium]
MVVEKLWIAPPEVDLARVARLAAELQVPVPVARVLVARGKDDPDVARRFLEPSLDDLADPLRLKGAEPAIARLRRAIETGERIVVLGDFDVDGVTGTSVAMRALGALGAKAEYLLPKRLVHGYGLSMKVLPDLLAREPALVLTVDCGIRSVDEVAELARHGVDTVITDHHEPGPDLPPAVAVVDPKQPGCEYPDKRLAGVGVVWQLMRGLARGYEHELELRRDLDLVALGTVADVVPLDGENRALVTHGLQVMNRREKPGMMALAAVAEIDDRLDAWHLGYLLGPRINAAGRLDDAEIAVRLFTTRDTAEASQLAARLDRENRDRQELSASTLTQALRAIEQGVAGAAPEGIVLASNGWHP